MHRSAKNQRDTILSWSYLAEIQGFLARPAGIEPATPGLEGRCSIRLSYGRDERKSAPVVRRGREYTQRRVRNPGSRRGARSCIIGPVVPADARQRQPDRSEPCMDLLIVRHAIAFERSPRRWRDDNERPLSPEGMARARKAAAGLKHIAERPQCVLSSPLVRARQTAAILAEFAGWPKAVECPALAPDEPPENVFAALAAQNEKIVAVVGHQPGLGRLLAACLPAQVLGGANPEAFDLKKMGAALVSFSATPRAGGGTLAWLVPPRILRATK